MSWKPGQSPVAHGVQIPATPTRAASPASLATPAVTAPTPLIKARDIAPGGISLASQISNTTSVWTPQLMFGGASTGITTQKNFGFIFNIGKFVYAFCQIELTSKGSATGPATIGGLPFVALNVPVIAGDFISVMPIAYGNMATAFFYAVAIAGSSNTLNLITLANGSANMGTMSNTDFTNTSAIGVPIVYISQ